MARLVADSSSIILLAKCGLLEIVCDLFDVLIPEAVRLEVASPDLAKTYPDVMRALEKQMNAWRDDFYANPRGWREN